MAALTETELRYEMAKDALQYIAERVPTNDELMSLTKLLAFIADLQEHARTELERKFT